MIHKFTYIQDDNELIRAGQNKLSHRSDIEQVLTPLQIHDPQSQDISYAMGVAREMVNIAGAHVVVYPRTDNSAYDTTFNEDADPTYGSGRHMKAVFKPEPIETKLTIHGPDADNKTKLIFCREQVHEVFGQRMLREGDIVELPFNSSLRPKPDRYRVLNASDFGNFKYTWLYISCVVENITGDDTIDITHK